MVSSPGSKDVWAGIAQTGARQESGRVATSSGKPGSVSVPQAAASSRVVLETALPHLHLSHLDENANPHRGIPRVHVTVYNHH